MLSPHHRQSVRRRTSIRSNGVANQTSPVRVVGHPTGISALYDGRFSDDLFDEPLL